MVMDQGKMCCTNSNTNELTLCDVVKHLRYLKNEMFAFKGEVSNVITFENLHLEILKPNLTWL